MLMARSSSIRFAMVFANINTQTEAGNSRLPGFHSWCLTANGDLYLHQVTV